MSKRLDVLKAVKALVQRALPAADVLGLDGDEAPPKKLAPGGLVIVRTGDPGEAEIDLSPLAYNWTHRIPIEVVRRGTETSTSEEEVDAMVRAIGDEVVADRTLGGLCDWLDGEAVTTDDVYVEGARPPRSADLVLVALYVTDRPF